MFKSIAQYVSASETESEPIVTMQNQLEQTIENKNKKIQTQMKSLQKTKIVEDKKVGEDQKEQENPTQMMSSSTEEQNRI